MIALNMRTDATGQRKVHMANGRGATLGYRFSARHTQPPDTDYSEGT